ncbi:MAG: TMEM175 family protein [Candidatus Margulisiibacteriota bacterium]
MVDSKSIEQEMGLTTNRIETLTDGVFAIAMTLLVLGLGLPQLQEGLTQSSLHLLLLSQLHKFFNYALSFVLLAVFWIIHHQEFHFIKRTDRVHIWINVFILMFIALIPFSASLIGDYPNDWMAELFFGANMFMVGILFQLNWFYATRLKRLVNCDIDPKKIVLGIKRGLVTPLVALLAMVLAFLDAPITTHIYLLIPIILFLPPFRK